jgi:hypothetical protein
VKQPRLHFAALAVFSLLVVGCDSGAPDTQSTPTSAPPAAVPSGAKSAAPAAPAAKAPSGAGRTVAFELVSPQPVGALQVDVAYTGEGRFVGDADAVDCQAKVEGALSSFNHIVDQHLLRAAFVAVKGFAGPVRFCECKFQGNATAENFTITVKDSSSPELSPLEPPPTVKVVLD